MPNCSAIGCTNRSSDKDGTVSFHRLPTTRRNIWLTKIKRKGGEKLTDIRICSNHFEEECFERDLKAELMGTDSRKRLKRDAVPTLFVFTAHTDKRTLSEARKEKASKQKYIDEACCSYKQEEYVSDTNVSDENVSDDNLSDERTFLLKNTRTEADIEVRSIGTQTDVSYGEDFAFHINNENTEPNLSSSDSEIEEESDESYIPSSQSSQESNASQAIPNTDKTTDPTDEVKLIVFWSALAQLLSFCQICRACAFIKSVVYKGCAVSVNMLCTSNHETTWNSMPKINGMFAGNLLLPAAILFTGETYTRFKELCDAIGIKCVGKTYYHEIQARYLFPYIHKIYKTCRGVLVANITEERPLLDLSGDARCDSPGYSATYSTYSLMDTVTNQVVHFHVTHVAQAGNSVKMEKNGLITLLDKVEPLGVLIRSLTTDRHPGVAKYLREERPDIKHQYDIWHFTKNIKKALLKAAKKKDCEIINDWVKAIISHFWWCCSSCKGNYEELKERWMSLTFHICNVHKWVGYHHFKKCDHPTLLKNQAKRKKWLKQGTLAFSEVEKIIKNKKTLSDLKQCTEFRHSGNLEVFHAVYLKFCPKRLRFSFEGMIARTELAILHFNASVAEPYAINRHGKQIYKLQYSKITKAWVIKKVKSASEKTYLDELLKEVVWLRESNEYVHFPVVDNPKIITITEKPDKEESIVKMKSRFRK